MRPERQRSARLRSASAVDAVVSISARTRARMHASINDRPKCRQATRLAGENTSCDRVSAQCVVVLTRHAVCEAAGPMPRLALVACVLLSACGAADVSDVELGADDKADSTPELRVRAADTTLWVDTPVTWNGTRYVLRGRTSRDLVDGYGFIFDDVYGEFAKVGARSFTLAWGSDVRSLLQGVDQFVSLTLKERSVT